MCVPLSRRVVFNASGVSTLLPGGPGGPIAVGGRAALLSCGGAAHRSSSVRLQWECRARAGVGAARGERAGASENTKAPEALPLGAFHGRARNHPRTSAHSANFAPIWRSHRRPPERVERSAEAFHGMNMPAVYHRVFTKSSKDTSQSREFPGLIGEAHVKSRARLAAPNPARGMLC